MFWIPFLPLSSGIDVMSDTAGCLFLYVTPNFRWCLV